MSKGHHDDSGELHFEQISHHGVAYEQRDLGIRGIVAFLIILMIFGVVICGAVWGYFDYHIKHLASVPPLTGTTVSMQTPEQQPEPTLRFPKPALQPDDVADLNAMLESNHQALSTYGWVDQKGGVARVPIDQAMKELAQKGLPTRPAVQPAQKADFGSGTSTVPGAAGGTRPETRQ